MTVPGFIRRARLRDKGMLAAIIVAHLRETRVDSMSCDQLAADLQWGRGQVIAACDELHRVGFVTKDRGVVALSFLAREGLDQAEAA